MGRPRPLTAALLWLVAWGAAAPARAATPTGARRLLVAVGNNLGRADEAPLQHAVRDARRIRDVMVSLGGVDTADAFVLAETTSPNLLAFLGTLGARVDARTEIFFYFSGHGDADSLHLGATSLPLTTLDASLQALPAAVHVMVLDACRLVGQSAKGFAPTSDFEVHLEAPPTQQGTIVLRSSSSGETALESTQLESAVFTHALVSALRGAADANGDGRVTLFEAYEYAYGHTVRRSLAGPVPQHPTIELDMASVGALVMTTPAAARATLVIPAGHQMQYLVFDRGRQVVMFEAWARAGASTTLAVPEGRFVVQRRAEGQSGATEIAVRAGERVVLASGDFRPFAGDELVAKGGAIAIYAHELSGLVAVGAGSPWAPLGEAKIAYGHGAGAWQATVDLGLARLGRNNQTSLFNSSPPTPVSIDQREWWGTLGAGIAYRLDGARLGLSVGLSAALFLIRQTTTTRIEPGATQTGPFAPADPAAPRWALGLGPELHIALDLALGPTFGWRLALAGTAAFIREANASGEAWALRERVAIGTGPRWIY